MKTIEQLHDEMIEAVAIQRAACQQAITETILKAKDCSVSKRKLLGLDKKHRVAQTPLYDSKGLF